MKTQWKRIIFKTNEDYFKFINKHRGNIHSIDVQWKDNKISCKYKLKEKSDKCGKDINNLVNNYVNNYDNISSKRNYIKF